MTKAVGAAVDIDDVKAYQKELRKAYIITKELSSLAGGLALKLGRWLAVANAALMTAKHIDFTSPEDVQHEPMTHAEQNPEQPSTTAE